ncbi:MAG TPA: Dickkopf N-terminal cysteine-rich domain-containing protein [Polyangiales bacterium]
MHQLGSERQRGMLRVVSVGVVALWMCGCGGTSDTSRHQTGTGGTAGVGGAGSGGHAGSSVAGSGGHAGQAGTTSNAGTGGGAGISVGMADAGTTATGKPAFNAGTEPNRNNVAPGDICDRLSEIQCAGEEHCCDNPGRSRADCKTAMLAGCRNTVALDAIASDPITGFDAAYAATSFTQFEQMASMCDPSVASWGTTVNGLRGILKGTRAQGSNCAPPAGTTLKDTAAIGAALASCTNSETTACLTTNAITWKCSRRNGSGGACITDLNCTDGLYCDNPAMNFGKCAPRKTPGAACGTPNECASLFCKGGKCTDPGVQAAYCLKN